MRKSMIVSAAVFVLSFFTSQAFAASSGSLDILRSGLLGAGTGAISAGMSGGKAGKGALIGAGTNVIGGALLGFLTEPSVSAGQELVYAQPSYYAAPAPQIIQQPVYQPEPVYAQAAPVYSQPSVDPNRQIIKQGILGAGVGAISASASGGKAGQGALIGAGTSVIGGALLDTLTAPSAQPVYYSAPLRQTAVPNFSGGGQAPIKHIIRKYDADGRVLSEEEFWQ